MERPELIQPKLPKEASGASLDTEKLKHDLQKGFRVTFTDKIHGEGVYSGEVYVATRLVNSIFVAEMRTLVREDSEVYPGYSRFQLNVRRKSFERGLRSGTLERWTTLQDTNPFSPHTDPGIYRIQPNRGGFLKEPEFLADYHSSVFDRSITEDLMENIIGEYKGKRTIRINWISDENNDGSFDILQPPK